MSTDSHSQHKDHLLRVLGGAQSSASSLQHLAQSLVRDATLSGEMAGCLYAVVQATPNSALSTQTWKQVTAGWEAQAKAMQEASRALASGTFSASTQAVAFTTSVSVLLSDDALAGPARTAAAHLREVLVRPALLEEVRELLRRFGLDEAPAGCQSPMLLIDQAHLALTHPGGPSAAPTAVLVPARESIHAALAALLLRRPEQEKTGKVSEKLCSIGRQCGNADLGPDHFERMGADVERLVAALSASKQDALSHEQVVALFNGALRFHRAFLGSLDAAKFEL